MNKRNFTLIGLRMAGVRKNCFSENKNNTSLRPQGRASRLPQANSSRLHISTRSAFTLIELLVVIAIIGILSAMLLPALGRVKATSKNNGCMSLMKQYALATSNYNTNWDQYMPDVQTYLLPEGDFTSSLGVKGDRLPPEEYVRCPADDSTEKLGRLGKCDQTDNGLDDFLYVSIGGSGSNLSNSASPTSKGPSVMMVKAIGPLMIRPADRVTWTDYQATSTDVLTGAYINPGQGKGKQSDTLKNNVFRHIGNSSNAAFMDGHAAPIRLIKEIKTVNHGHDLAEGHQWNPPLNQEFPYGPRPANTTINPAGESKKAYVHACPDNPTVIWK